MQKLAVQTGRGRRGGTRPLVARPPRTSALSGASVGLVLGALGSSRRRLNDYLVLLHVTAGLAMLAFCTEDVLGGGPTRPMIIPVLGAYMSASVVFYATLKERSPTLLIFINGLSDIVFLVAAHRLAYLSLGSLGSDLTVAFLIAVVASAYGAAGETRLSAALGAIVSVFFAISMVSPSTGYPVLDARSTLALLVVCGSALLGVRIATAVRRHELAASIHRLEHLESAVAIHRLRSAATPPGTPS